MTLLLLLLVGILLVGLGYGFALMTQGPMSEVLLERLRVEREMRMAELQLRHLSHEAMRRLLKEARD